MKREKWKASEERMLLKLINEKKQPLSVCFTTVSSRTGRSKKAVEQHYYKSMRNQAIPEEPQETNERGRRWGKEEDDTLLRYMDAHGIGNLKACFIAVAEQIGRTPTAVAAHWYSVLSMKKDVKVFNRISKTDILWNRKNGEGKPSTLSIWRRILRVLRSL